jgi:hypothetical protein
MDRHMLVWYTDHRRQCQVFDKNKSSSIYYLQEGCCCTAWRAVKPALASLVGSSTTLYCVPALRVGAAALGGLLFW